MSRNLLAAVCAILLTGCASTEMTSILRKPDFRSDHIRHVLIIGNVADSHLRKMFEDEFVRQWSVLGVHAVSSLQVLPSTQPMNRAEVADLAKAQGFDAVLVTRLLSRKKVAAGKPPRSGVLQNPGDNIQDVNAVMQVIFAPPIYVNDYELATVESNLYDVASEQRVWSGISETREMRKIPKLIPPFVKLILKRLYASHPGG